MFQRNLYLQHIKAELSNDTILFLIWPRQAGKTTLLLNLEKHNIITSNHIFISLDEYFAKSFSTVEDFLDFIFITWNNYNPDYIILDEIQTINNIGILLKWLYDKIKREQKNIKILASGSWSLQIFKWISDSLIGRKSVIHVYPFSFQEVIEYKGYDIDHIFSKPLSPSIIEKLLKERNEFLLFGGYPKVVTQPDKTKKLRIIKHIYEDYIHKDISFFLKHEELPNFHKLLTHIAYSVWNLTKQHTIAKSLSIPVSQVKKFLFVLEQTFLLQHIPSFGKNKHKEIIKHAKCYFVDMGILRMLLWIPSLGWEIQWKFTENFVIMEFTKNLSDLHKIYFWQNKNGSEIDVVIENIESWKITPCEIKTWSRTTMPIIFKSFYQTYREQIDHFRVYTKDTYQQKTYNDKKIQFLSYLDLLSYTCGSKSIDA